MAIVSVRQLVKRYGDLVALDHFDLTVERGEIFGLLGHNGCGKTTAINCMLSLLTYDKGTIELFGEWDLRATTSSGGSASCRNKWPSSTSLPLRKTSTLSARSTWRTARAAARS